MPNSDVLLGFNGPYVLMEEEMRIDDDIKNVDLAKIDSTEVGVTVKAWYERKLVEDAVWTARGVTQVVDSIRVA